MDKPEESAHGIAAFTLAQIAVGSQLKSDNLPRQVAAQMLKDGIDANAKGNSVNRKAAEMLQTVLEIVKGRQATSQLRRQPILN